MFLDRLDSLMKERNINKPQLAKESGIPYATIAHLYTSGYEQIRLSTLQKLSIYFGCTIDYLVKDEIEEDKYEIQRLYDAADEKTKRIVNAALKGK